MPVRNWDRRCGCKSLQWPRTSWAASASLHQRQILTDNLASAPHPWPEARWLKIQSFLVRSNFRKFFKWNYHEYRSMRPVFRSLDTSNWIYSIHSTFPWAIWAVVVAQLVEQSLSIPEIRVSNPDIGIIISTNCIIDKTKIKKKRPGMAHS